MKKAFTLAEIMIVLTVIGVLSAILLPAAFQAAPDEGVLKFKKAYNTLGTVVRELTTSEKYYKDGDLGTQKSGTASGTSTFCTSLSEILATKELNCGTTGEKAASADNAYVIHKTTASKTSKLDDICKGTGTKNQIVTVDGIYWWEAGSIAFSNAAFYDPKETNTSPCNGTGCENGFDATYKVLCIDVDGPENGNKGKVAPFGFGIRRDGKILAGARANCYAGRSVQKGKEASTCPGD